MAAGNHVMTPGQKPPSIEPQSQKDITTSARPRHLIAASFEMCMGGDVMEVGEVARK